jgi:DNA-binding PadR family transcriptional regulator
MTNAELVILSLIAEQPRHGYEIETVIEERGMRNWTEVGFSSIYYLLKKLEKTGLIEGHMEMSQGQGPARKVYRLTPIGHGAWRKATIEALSTPTPYYSSFRIGLSNLPGISTAEALSSIRKYREALSTRAEQVRDRWTAQQSRLPYHADALFDLSMTLLDAELSWVSSFIHQLEQRHGGS